MSVVDIIQMTTFIFLGLFLVIGCDVIKMCEAQDPNLKVNSTCDFVRVFTK